MILRGGHRRRQVAEAELFQARQEALLLLAAKHPEHELRGIGGAAPRHHGENEAGEIGMIEIGDAAPSQPFAPLLRIRALRSFSLPAVCLRHASAPRLFTRFS